MLHATTLPGPKSRRASNPGPSRQCSGGQQGAPGSSPLPAFKPPLLLLPPAPRALPVLTVAVAAAPVRPPVYASATASSSSSCPPPEASPLAAPPPLLAADARSTLSTLSTLPDRGSTYACSSSVCSLSPAPRRRPEEDTPMRLTSANRASRPRPCRQRRQRGVSTVRDGRARGQALVEAVHNEAARMPALSWEACALRLARQGGGGMKGVQQAPAAARAGSSTHQAASWRAQQAADASAHVPCHAGAAGAAAAAGGGSETLHAPCLQGQPMVAGQSSAGHAASRSSWRGHSFGHDPAQAASPAAGRFEQWPPGHCAGSWAGRQAAAAHRRGDGAWVRAGGAPAGAAPVLQGARARGGKQSEGTPRSERRRLMCQATGDSGTPCMHVGRMAPASRQGTKGQACHQQSLATTTASTRAIGTLSFNDRCTHLIALVAPARLCILLGLQQRLLLHSLLCAATRS